STALALLLEGAGDAVEDGLRHGGTMSHLIGRRLVVPEQRHPRLEEVPDGRPLRLHRGVDETDDDLIRGGRDVRRDREAGRRAHLQGLQEAGRRYRKVVLDRRDVAVAFQRGTSLAW